MKTAHKSFLVSMFAVTVILGCVCVLPASGQIPVKADDGSVLTPTQLKMWNSSEFQAQFTQSYIAETEIEPKVTQDEREQLQKVLKLVSAEKMDDAVKLLLKKRNNASSAVFDYMLANIYFQQEKLEDAAREYQAAVQDYPKFRRAWKNLGLVYVRQGELSKALVPFTKVISLGGGDSLTYGLLGYGYSSVEDYIASESAYRMAVMLDPATMDWKMGLVRSLFKQQRYASAAAMCQTLLVSNPDSTDLWLLQANAYIGLKQPLKAAENYELVDRLGKSTPASINMLGDIYVNEELYELAANCYAKAMEKSENPSPDRAIRAAKVMAARAAFDQTNMLIEKITGVCGETLSDSQRKSLLKLRARIAVSKGASDAEAEILKQIVELDGLDGEALILLGKHSRRSGDMAQAIFYFERAAKIEKYEADAYTQHAQLLVSQGKYSEAVVLLKKAQQINPRDDIANYLQQVERVSKDR